MLVSLFKIMCTTGIYLSTDHITAIVCINHHDCGLTTVPLYIYGNESLYNFVIVKSQN